MIRTLRVGTLALLVACMLSSTAINAVRADKDDAKKEKEEAEKLAKIKKAGEAIDVLTQGKGKAAAIAKANELVMVMYAFKPHAKGGLGKGDGYEVRIRNLASKKPLSAAALAKEAPDLTRLAEVSKAIAEVLEGYPLPKKEKDKIPANWVRYNKEMKKASSDLIEAVKSMKSDAVKKAGTALNGACVNCHREFRDTVD